MLIAYFIIFFIAFKNSAKFFFQYYSLSTVNGYYSIINFISIFFATFFTRLRSFKVTMERQLGYQFSDFQDAFAVSSLFLTLFKLYIFLVYLEQVSPIVGIPFLAIMGFFSLRYSLILVIRDLVVALFVNPLFNIKNQLEVFDYSKLFKLEFYLYCLFVILISFRVLIYGEPILFFFLNSFFLYYLLFHKLLFIVFFYSLILSISRFAFLSSDYTLIKLYHKLNNISYMGKLDQPTKRIKFTRKNIIILVSWITRTYEFRDVLLIYREDDREKSYSRDSTNKLIDYENVVDTYIQSENSIFIAAIEKYNSWRLPQSKAKINIIHTFRILTLYDMQVEIKVKYINFLFYLSGLVLILLYTIQPEEYLEIDYVAAFVSFKLSKISHLKERTTVVSVKKKEDSQAHISKIIEEKRVELATIESQKEYRTRNYTNLELFNMTLAPFTTHPWNMLQDKANLNIAYIINASTGIHTELFTPLQYLQKVNNIKHPLKVKTITNENTVLFTPFLQINSENLDVSKFNKVNEATHTVMLETFNKKYVLDLNSILKLKREDPFFELFKIVFQSQMELTLPYPFKILFLNPFSISDFKLNNSSYSEFISFSLLFCNTQVKNSTLSEKEKENFYSFMGLLNRINKRIVSSPSLYWNNKIEASVNVLFEDLPLIKLINFSELASVEKKGLQETILKYSDGLLYLNLMWGLDKKDFPNLTDYDIDYLCKSIYSCSQGHRYLNYNMEHLSPENALLHTNYIVHNLLLQNASLNAPKVPITYSDFYNDALLFHSQRKPISHDLALIKDKPKMVDNSLDDLD